MTKYKEEIVDAIKEATYNATDGRNLTRRGHDDLVEFYVSKEKQMLNELDEVYRKVALYDKNYAMETSVVPTASIVQLEPRLRKGQAFDRAKEKLEQAIRRHQERLMKDPFINRRLSQHLSINIVYYKASLDMMNETLEEVKADDEI